MNQIMSFNDTNFYINRAKTDISSSMKSYHYHKSFEVYYLYAGERNYFIKDKTFHVKKGNLVLINEYDIHCTKESNQSGHERIVFNFNKAFMENNINNIEFNLYECFEKDVHIIQLDDKEQLFIETLLLNMIDEYKNKQANYIDCIKSNIIQILLIANRHIDDEFYTKNIETKRTNKTISNIIGYINNNYFEDITLDFISKKFYISSYYLSRIFKQSTNYSFVDYLNNIRIKEAQKLLVRTDMNITSISEKVGYKSPTHFGRTFKKITGISPSSFKKMLN